MSEDSEFYKFVEAQWKSGIGCRFVVSKPCLKWRRLKWTIEGSVARLCLEIQANKGGFVEANMSQHHHGGR